ncbi:MAG: hypothetical protein K1X53_06185 [Candidatus Sumerlaeaceae bacterium]|nr:hypothetical protein [Candidatus Sumerlaeaceae bacterium]
MNPNPENRNAPVIALSRSGMLWPSLERILGSPSCFHLSVHYATDPRNAISLALSSSEGAVIVTDIAATDYGASVFHTLRRAQPGIPWIVLNDQWNPDFAAQVLEAGAIACLNSETLSPDLFVAVVNKARATWKLQEQFHAARGDMLRCQRLATVAVNVMGVVHDFNNVLTAVIGNSEALLENLPVGSESAKQVRTIIDAAVRGGELAHQALVYSGTTQLKPTPLDLSECLRDCTSLIRMAVPPRMILRLQFDDGLPPANLVPVQIQQIILNLVTNSVESIGMQNGTIFVRTKHATREEFHSLTSEEITLPEGIENGVVIEVADTGCGMDAETKARVFQPFYSTKAMDRGLGMAIISQIVESHGGAIHIDSERDLGCTVRIFFPAVPESGQLVELSHPSGNGQGEIRPRNAETLYG